MATKKATTKKAVKANKVNNSKKQATSTPEVLPAKLQEVLEEIEEVNEGGEEGGKIQNILYLFNQGFTKKQIVDAGYNRSTVYRQVRELEKLQKAPALEYYGYPLFEAKVQQLAKRKGITRDAAYKQLMRKLDESSTDEA